MAVKRHSTHWDLTAGDQTKSAFDSVERNFKRTQDAGTRMAQSFTAVLGATLLSGLVRSAAQAAIEAERSSTRLTAVLRVAGGAAGVTRREIEQLSEALADSTLFDDEGIRNAAGELVKFGNIHGNIFRDALEISADLAAFMGTDVPQAAQMIGRALQSPTEGIRMLEREFGRLTEAEEAHIETLVAEGRAVEAQVAVLELMRRKVAGTAQEMNTGLTKATGDLSDAWSDLMEEVGKEGTLFNRTLGGATQLMRDLKGELEGVRTPLSDLYQDSLAWVQNLIGGAGFVGNLTKTINAQREQARRTVSGRIGGTTTQAERLQGITDFEAALSATPASPVVLGGRTTTTDRGRSDERSGEVEAQAIVDAEEMAAQDSREAWEAYYKFIQDAEKQLADGRELMWKQVFETIDQEQEDAIRQGEELLEAEAEAMARLKDAALDLGFAFESSFERAILGGERLSEVLRGLVQDIAQIALRAAITRPLGEAIASGVGGLFGGGGGSYAPANADVPQYATGTNYVPADGLAYLHRGEAVVPANMNRGGRQIVQHIHFSANTPAAVRDAIFAFSPQLAEMSKRAVYESLQSGVRP